jgi:HTH-type transcriptional regulator/antitoxin HigA
MAAKQIGLSRDLLIHPGETLREAIDDRGMDQRELALRTAFTEKHISKVLNGKSSISPKFAMALKTALGIDAVFWLNLQTNYDIELASLERPETVESGEFDILQELKDFVKHWQKEGSMTKGNDKKEHVLQLRGILGVEKLTIIPDLRIVAAFRTANSKTINPYAMFAWIKLCELAVAKQRAKKLPDVEKLKKSIPVIRALLFAKAEVLSERLKCVFNECGIKFCIVRHFRGAPVQGFIEKNLNNEMILCMTIRQKFADIFWFSLFHEIGHIVSGDIPARFIDYYDMPDERERLADEFAKNILIPPDSYMNFLQQKNFSFQSIIKFAQAVKVPSYIVIGRLQKEGHVSYNNFSSEKLRYEWA